MTKEMGNILFKISRDTTEDLKKNTLLSFSERISGVAMRRDVENLEKKMSRKGKVTDSQTMVKDGRDFCLR